MPTRRDALVAAGLAKPGRGKFSKDALAWLDAERAKGVKFSDDDGAPSRVSTKKPSQSETPKPAKVEGIGYPDYLFPSDFRYPETEYRAIARINGKKVEYGMREACNNCRVSLVNHGCDAPTIHGNIAVSIERR